VRLLGDAERLKFGAVTVRLIVTVLFRIPEVPVTVTVTVPAVAELLAISVRVLAAIVLAGLKDAVTPLGSPAAARLTLPLKPFCGPTVSVLTPLFPWAILRLLGDAESVKFGAVTVRLIVAVLFRIPDVPVTVTVAVPTVAELLAISVRVLAAAVLAGLNDAVTPFGSPAAARLTLPLKPFCGLTVSVLTPLYPWPMLRLPGDAERLKLGAVIVRLMLAVLLKVPEVPVTVTVPVPGVAEPAATNVRIFVPAVLAGVNDAVTPFGSPDAARLTLPLKPFSGPTVRVLTPLLPGEIESVSGDAESVNAGAANAPLRSSMRDCPPGEPHPVARS
jgi:hypothetical protein